jgi:N-acetyl-gamma-glutamyl-phosphate reductase
MKLAPELLRQGAKVIDLSADFRLKSTDLFRQWYGEHSSPELLAQAVYGLPEIYADKIKSASLVANPGCYPTSVILALAPIIQNKLLDPHQIIIADSKSGVTGAGRGALLSNSFCEVQDNFKSYKTVGHRHTPEIVQELSSLAGSQIKISFTPHLLPINRGILSTIYVKLNQNPSLESLREIYRGFYQNAKFVRVKPLGISPETADVRGTNFCDLGLFYDKDNGLWKIISVIDNLCRGAGGQAVANLNLITGRSEDHGLVLAPLRP